MEIEGLKAMNAEAARFIGALVRYKNGATVVALSGDLGSGKTTFAQGIAKALGVEETVTSPTFVIEKIYELQAQPFDIAQGKKFSHLIHIDAYRLKDEHELEVLGWKEIIADPSNLIVIEWPEKVAVIIPENAIRISFIDTGNARELTYTPET